MTNIRAGNEIIKDQTVHLDEGHFVKKSFVSCRLVYGGGLPPVLRDVDFIDSTFTFTGAALNTSQFLAGIAQSGEEGKELVDRIIGLN